MTLLDGILIGITLISALLAMLRGFSREVLSVGSWIAAAVVALLYHPLVMPYVARYIESETIVMAVSIGVVFVVVLIIATFITVKIADFIIDSRVGPLDRTLGFIFGAARGILIVVIGAMFLNWILKDDVPAWVANAKSKPMLDNIGDRLANLLPEDGVDDIMKRFNEPEEKSTQTGQDV